MSNSSILDAFINHLSTTLPVAYQGINFTPPDSGEWLEVKFFPNPNNRLFIGSNDPVEVRGIFQITVCYRPGSGVINGAETAQSIIDQYPQDAAIGSVKVELKPWDSGPIEEDERISHPITIRYRGLI